MNGRFQFHWNVQGRQGQDMWVSIISQNGKILEMYEQIKWH